MANTPQAQLSDILKSAPKNWKRWGPEDEIGALNLLTAQQVLRGVAAVRQGRVFTLGLRIADPAGDPVWPGRAETMRYNTQDRSTYVFGKTSPAPGGNEYADDVAVMFLQGTTHTDALGHAWHDGQIYNGYSADTTVRAMSKASVLPLAEHGIVGRAVLIDIARHLGKDHLERGETFKLRDVLAAADKQKSPLERGDILLIRTGWLKVFYEKGKEAFYQEPFTEPGLVYEPEVPKWFHEMEIPAFGTDTAANEVTYHPPTGVVSALHNCLMRNLGVVFTELLSLDVLADDCANDGQYSFLYVGAPLKVVGGTGSPTNPVAVK
jgi:kynurenine formamidase